MNSRMHERITAAALRRAPRTAALLGGENAAFAVTAANYPDYYWGRTPDAPPRPDDDPDWGLYVLVPLPDGARQNAHLIFEPLRLRGSYPVVVDHWLDRALFYGRKGDGRRLAGFFGCLSHLIGDTAQAAHLVDERLLADLFPQRRTRYITHGAIEAVDGPIWDDPAFAARPLAADIDELRWRLLEELAALQRREKAELPVMLRGIEENDPAATAASAGRSARHAAELLAEIFEATAALLAGTAAGPDRLPLSTLTAVEEHSDGYFNYRSMVDFIPGPDPYHPLPLDPGSGPMPGLAMLPTLTPRRAGVREAYAEYALPAGAFGFFRAVVGLNRGKEHGTGARFEVWLDGEKSFESPRLDAESPPLAIGIPLGRASRLRLRVVDARADAFETRFFYPVWGGAELVRRRERV